MSSHGLDFLGGRRPTWRTGTYAGMAGMRTCLAARAYGRPEMLRYPDDIVTAALSLGRG